MIKNVILDLNGVLIRGENLTDRLASEYHVSTKESIPAVKDMLKAVRQPHAKSVYELMSPYFQKWNLNLSEEEFLNFWFSGESLVAEALEYIKDLRSRGIQVFVLSNNFKERTEYYKANFQELFTNLDGVYFSWLTGHVKPGEGEEYAKAWSDIIEKEKLNPSETIYFDDKQENVAAAESVGIKAHLFEGFREMRDLIEDSTKEFRIA